MDYFSRKRFLNSNDESTCYECIVGAQCKGFRFVIIRAASSGGTRSTTTTVTTTVTARVRGTPPGRGGDTAEVEEETREMELFAALEELVANH